MKIHRLVVLVAASVALAACDTSTSPAFGSIGSNSTGAGLSITPKSVALHVGGTAQLGTNATTDQQTSLEWNSLESTIAVVSPSGVVTAVAAGTATITVRLSTDTTSSASATVVVSP